MDRFYRKLPEEIKSILLLSEGWLVGGSIKSIIDYKVVNDYDIIVPDRQLYHTTCKIYCNFVDKFEINNFGGLKLTFKNGIEIDMWCEELDYFLKKTNKIEYLFNYKKNILLQNAKS